MPQCHIPKEKGLNRNVARRAAGAGAHPDCGIWEPVLAGEQELGSSAVWGLPVGRGLLELLLGAALSDAGKRDDGSAREGARMFIVCLGGAAQAGDYAVTAAG